jgi:quercetin dioxygenase-like cupin family protein
MKTLVMVALALAPSVAFADEAMPEAVEKALIEAEPKLHRCWEQAAAADYRVEGTVELRVIVGAGGRAARVEVRGNSMGKRDLPTDLEECALKAFADARFGGAFAEGDAVDVPITFKAEPNVTLKRDDAPGLAMKGTQATARILVDEKVSGAKKASLTFIEIQAGSRWQRPNGQGTAVIFVLKGRVKAGPTAATTGDVVILDEGSAHPFNASMRSELLVLLVPPGGEQAYRDGATIPTAATGAEPRVIKRNSAQKYDILGGKGEVRILVENEKASVDFLRTDAGVEVPVHVHGAEAEILYITEGKGTMTVDGSSYPVEPFMAIHVPPGAKHGFVATTPVEAVQFYAPAGPEQRFKKP